MYECIFAQIDNSVHDLITYDLLKFITNGNKCLFAKDIYGFVIFVFNTRSFHNW